jgi:hypothetical protein
VNTDPNSPVEYVIHPAMRPWLDGYLRSQGFAVVRAPMSMQDPDPEAMPTFFVFPTDERMGLVNQDT